MKRKKLLKTIEITTSLLIFAALWIGLSFNVGGPIYSDELLYIEIGLNNQNVPNYGNRYFHVYLQKAFMALAPTPLIGIRVYWAFTISLTALMVYWSARSFLKDSTFIHGLLAAGFFFSYRLISSYAGVTSADITAMMMTTALIFVYLQYQHTSKKWLLVTLGALSFLAFKTKETTLFANIVMVGFFFDEDGKFAFKNVVPYLKNLLIGFTAGIGLFIVLDSVFLGQPFFAISPTTFREVFQNYAYTGGFRKEPVNWYQIYLLDDIMIPFVVFIISGVKLRTAKTTPQKKVVWIFPLLLVCFITINMLKIPWGFIERFYFPALPVIAMLAPQFISLKISKDGKDMLKMAGILLVAMLLVVLLRQFGMNYVTSIDWTYGKYLESIVFPILLSVLIGLVIVIEKQNLLTLGILLVCLGSWMLPQLSYNYKYIYNEPTTGQKFQAKYQPFLAHQDEITASDDVKMLITATIYENSDEEMRTLSNNPYDLLGMYNMLFDQRTTRDNLVIVYQIEDVPDTVLAEPFDFMLLSTIDWEYLGANMPDVIEQLEQVYSIHIDEEHGTVFLDR
ncbi:MAG: hypothetical protein GYA18_04890 [Chloroflexi bacterium]|nr:hypothetical protein [Chloroflexota bacterium]